MVGGSVFSLIRAVWPAAAAFGARGAWPKRVALTVSTRGAAHAAGRQTGKGHGVAA